MKIKIGITGKLTTLFFILIFIFYGTFLILFLDVKKLMETSEHIISTNNQIESISKTILDNLISMDVNIRKFRLLKKDTYFKYFTNTKMEFNSNIDKILGLNSEKYPVSEKWGFLKKSFGDHLKNSSETREWVDEKVFEGWIKTISQGRRENQSEIEKSLIRINYLGKSIFEKSLIGLSVSFIAGLLGAYFVSRSMIRPIKTLKKGLNNISSDSEFEIIKINSKDEFGDLARAFNNMSRQLKEDERIRSDFIAMLSHEIRTPLSSIRESVNMMEENLLGPVNKKQEKFLKIASSEILRINDLLDYLLDVSKLESDIGDFKREVICPNRILKEVSTSLISKEKINNVKIRIHENKDVPLILGGRKEIVQVLLNIIHNAVKFSPKDSFVDIFLLMERKGFITFQIKDQGPGIPEDEKMLIFRKYYRTKVARDHEDGTGLGLNISKRIIDGHGGKIYVKNNPDTGCSFFFTLPIENCNKDKK